MPPSNMLDYLADCAKFADFPGTIFKRWFEGAHARSMTQELIIQGNDGNTYRVAMDRVPAEAVDEVLKDAHLS